jgi:hypothetical protein
LQTLADRRSIRKAAVVVAGIAHLFIAHRKAVVVVVITHRIQHGAFPAAPGRAGRGSAAVAVLHQVTIANAVKPAYVNACFLIKKKNSLFLISNERSTCSGEACRQLDVGRGAASVLATRLLTCG